MFLRIGEAHARSLTKAVTWRIVGSLDTFVLGLIITHNLVWAGSIASIETLTKITLYYAHERVWTFIPWGRDAARASPAARPRLTPAEAAAPSAPLP